MPTQTSSNVYREYITTFKPTLDFTSTLKIKRWNKNHQSPKNACFLFISHKISFDGFANSTIRCIKFVGKLSRTSVRIYATTFSAIQSSVRLLPSVAAVGSLSFTNSCSNERHAIFNDCLMLLKMFADFHPFINLFGPNCQIAKYILILCPRCFIWLTVISPGLMKSDEVNNMKWATLPQAYV